MQIEWLNSAVDDLVEARQFIERYNPRAAMRASAVIIEAIRQLYI